MVFNSLVFLAFLSVVFLAYWGLGRRAQNLLLAAAGFVFYGWWDWRFLGLVVFSIVVDYAAGIRIEEARTDRGRRAWLGVSLVTQLGMLGFFKYYDFGVESMAALLRSVGFDAHPEPLRLVLPVGISFYTFQSLSYTIDVYRRRLPATRDFVGFTAFIMFFPQLVAGPIERASNLLGQFAAPRRFDPAAAADGMRRMLWGLVLKTVVADNCARIADDAYASPAATPGLALLVGTWAFAWQIYGDFAGYSHVAIGCARLFGISLMRNFDTPYFAQSLPEFWRRWHISLSTWFRDYVYVPLGGNRAGPLRRRVNVVVTFVLSGIWHGAGFHFMLWGLLHGLGVAAWPASRPDDASAAPVRPASRLRAALAAFLVFQAVCAGWVFFRARSADEAFLILGRIGAALGDVSRDAVRAALRVGDGAALATAGIVALVVAAEWFARRHPHALAALPSRRAARWAVYCGLVLAIVAVGRREEIPFLYFQF